MRFRDSLLTFLNHRDTIAEMANLGNVTVRVFCEKYSGNCIYVRHLGHIFIPKILQDRICFKIHIL